MLTLLSKDGRRAIPLSLINDQDFVALDELASVFQLAIREESVGAITATYKGKTMILTPDQTLASVSGRLVSLPSAPVRVGRRLFVPVEVIGRALAPMYDTRLELRKASRLLIAGDLRVPRLTVRYETVGASARLTIDAAPRTPSTVSQESNQVTVKFDADALDVGALAVQPDPVVQAIRVVDPATLIVDVGPRFAGFRATTQPTDSTARLTLDLLSTQAETLASATPPAAPPPAAPAPPPDLSSLNQPTSLIRTIAIDPGHGGEDKGVQGAGGTLEKDLTLIIARRLRASIEARLGVRVLLTRDDDRDVSPDSRAAVANNNKADIFISLHANASLRPTVSGAAVLYAAFDREAEQATRASLGSERLPAFGGGMRDVELVMWDLAQIRHVDRSGDLAKLLNQQFEDRIPLGPIPVSRAPLRVLESANMPAVLIEMGYLSNPDQEKQLTDGDFQATIVQAIYDAILRYRDSLGAGGAP